MPIALHSGYLFAGRYQVSHLMAEGGMGAIYDVVQLGTGRRRALKVMQPHVLQSPELRERFALEARVAGEVQSEFIVEVIDAGVDHTTQMPFLVMELLNGEELGKRLRRMGRFPPEEVVTYLRQAAMALDKTHKAAIIHRDLKPENMFLTQRDDGSPRIKILDFGVAKVLAEGATAAKATQSLGTPLYMPPEQFQIATRLTPAADIYALGMIAYTLLVGEAYWRAEAKLAAGEVIAFAMVAVKGPVEPPVQRAAAHGVTLPAGFDAWFMKATAANPADRFARATEAMSALSDVFGFALLRPGSMPSYIDLPAAIQAPSIPGSGPALTPIGAAVTKPLSRRARWRRGPMISLIVLAASISLVGVLGGFYLLRTRGTIPAPAAAADPSAPSVTQTAAATAELSPPVAGIASAEFEPSSATIPSGSASSMPPSKPLTKPAPLGSLKGPPQPSSSVKTKRTEKYSPD